MSALKKKDVVEAVAEKTGLSKAGAGQAVDAMLDTIMEALRKGEEVQFTGFGTFLVSNQQARTGVNPATKEKIQIAARKSPKFKAGKALKDIVA